MTPELRERFRRFENRIKAARALNDEAFHVQNNAVEEITPECPEQWRDAWDECGNRICECIDNDPDCEGFVTNEIWVEGHPSMLCKPCFYRLRKRFEPKWAKKMIENEENEDLAERMRQRLWMETYAKTLHQDAKVMYDTECGFGRPCVGLSVQGVFPDYEVWEETPEDDEGDYGYVRTDTNGDVWRPEDAYHKHPCVAVLGTGPDAERQLYEWLKWFHDHDFRLEAGDLDLSDLEEDTRAIRVMLGMTRYARMVRG